MQPVNAALCGKLCLPVLGLLSLIVPVLPSAAPPLPLLGYVCPTCPSAPHPSALLASLHPAYTHVAFAFAGWAADGSIINQWDAPDKGFALNASVVAALQARGLSVSLSAGGGAGNVLPGAPPPGFAANMLAGLSALVTSLRLDGIDFDLENWPGDVPGILAAAAAVRAVAAGLRAAHPALRITGAPQMTDVYADYPAITAGFNRYTPLLAGGAGGVFDALMPQMYNTWAQVETAAYAQTYARELIAGFAVSGGGPAPFNVSVPAEKLWLGFPASRQAAGSGFLAPADVVAAVRELQANGTRLGGLMTWSAGWDQQSGWVFADAVAAG